MGDFQEALGALLGKDAPNLSPSVVARLRGEWEADHARWQRRDLSVRRYVYLWADGVYLQARLEPQADCTWRRCRGGLAAQRRSRPMGPREALRRAGHMRASVLWTSVPGVLLAAASL